MTNKVPQQRSTKEIALTAKYFDTPSSFFANFLVAWNAVKSKVWKLETRQVYIEAGNPSYELLMEGKKAEAISVLPEIRQQADGDLYDDLIKRNVEFIRCRPVIFPITEYLEWEIACYHYNSNHGEKIFFLTVDEWAKKFKNYALHDFMIFDDNLAFIHNYDEVGEIMGGWMTTNENHITALQTLFSEIKSVSIEYKSFLRSAA